MIKKLSIEIQKQIAPILLEGGVGVLPTDTLYGLVGGALKEETVERIYKLRKRDLKKPMIILISSLKDLEFFGIDLNAKQKKVLKNLWPGKVSIVFECVDSKFKYLHRSKKSLAFRLPNDEQLLKLLKKVGPLVAPSTNLAGEKPAANISEAKKYFGAKVDFYVDAGTLKSAPSTLVGIDGGGKLKILRAGAVKVV